MLSAVSAELWVSLSADQAGDCRDQELLRGGSGWVFYFLHPQPLSQEQARFTELVKDIREGSSFAELTVCLRLVQTPVNFILTMAMPFL